jgi:hypothetical protein
LAGPCSWSFDAYSSVSSFFLPIRLVTGLNHVVIDERELPLPGQISFATASPYEPQNAPFNRLHAALQQLHDSYKKQVLKHAKSKFNELAEKKCDPLYEGAVEERIMPHKLSVAPNSRASFCRAS